ncbi:MAG: hypothetical protein ACOYJ1_15025 [Peptococcales bacterium]
MFIADDNPTPSDDQPDFITTSLVDKYLRVKPETVTAVYTAESKSVLITADVGKDENIKTLKITLP